jgi:hypothetical protein
MVEMRATFIEHYCDITADSLCMAGWTESCRRRPEASGTA